MPASYTPLGFIKQATGENESTWGDFLNNGGLELIDEAIRGRTAFSLSGSKTLTSTNGVSTEARRAILHVTGGTGGTVTIPNYSKEYVVINQSSGAVLITAGGALNATVSSGSTTVVVSDGSDVRGLQINGLDLKAYIDAQAFAETDLPGITPSTKGQGVSNDGADALWRNFGIAGARAISAATTISADDKEKLIVATGSFTQPIPSAATLTALFGIYFKNAGTGTIVLDPNGAETIDGAATKSLNPGQQVIIFNDGVALYTIDINPTPNAWVLLSTFTISGSPTLIPFTSISPLYAELAFEFDNVTISAPIVPSIALSADGVSYSAAADLIGAAASVLAGEVRISGYRRSMGSIYATLDDANIASPGIGLGAGLPGSNVGSPFRVTGGVSAVRFGLQSAGSYSGGIVRMYGK